MEHKYTAIKNNISLQIGFALLTTINSCCLFSCGHSTPAGSNSQPVGNSVEATDTSISPIEPVLVLVKSGSYAMGGMGEDEGPSHIVSIDSFYMGKYEVTVAEFRRFIKNTSNYITDAERVGYSNVFSKSHYDQRKGVTWEYDGAGTKRSRSEDNHPVVNISWNDAVAFCSWLSLKTGKNFRLPTEAEWEYVAKGGENHDDKNYSGDDKIENVAWYAGNSNNTTHPVGQKKANCLGIYDLTGNAWEWCQDWYDPKYYFVGPAHNPPGPVTGTNRVLRGGNWGFPNVKCRVTNRFSNLPGDSFSLSGFRVVCDAQKQPK